jgi:hypothetical protein
MQYSRISRMPLRPKTLHQTRREHNTGERDIVAALLK